MDDHYIAWRQSHDSPATEYVDGEGPFSFCSYPFLLNPRAKSKLLHTEAKFMMNHTVQQARTSHRRLFAKPIKMIGLSCCEMHIRLVSPSH